MRYQTIGFIGCGNMAGAIISGILRGGLASPEEIIGSAPSQRAGAALGSALEADVGLAALLQLDFVVLVGRRANQVHIVDLPTRIVCRDVVENSLRQTVVLRAEVLSHARHLPLAFLLKPSVVSHGLYRKSSFVNVAFLRPNHALCCREIDFKQFLNCFGNIHILLRHNVFDNYVVVAAALQSEPKHERHGCH